MRLTDQQRKIVAFLGNSFYTVERCERYYREKAGELSGKDYSFNIKMINQINAYMQAVDDLIKAVTNATSGQREGLADDGGDGINQGQECIPPAPPERENREAKNEKGVQENAIQSTVRRKATGRRKNPRFKIG